MSSLILNLMRWIVALVCRIKGHRYYSYDYSFNSWSAYTCMRCGCLSRQLQDLPDTPEDEWHWDDQHPTAADLDADFKVQARWIQRLSWPRWPLPWSPS